MIEYKGQLNLGNEALGSEKTITANEVLRTADVAALAREIHHQNALIPEQVAQAVLENFCAAAVEKMAEGFAVQLTNGQDVMLRLYPDIHVVGGNINLARAKELDPTVTELTEQNVGELIDKAGGVTLRVRASVQAKLTDLLMAQDPKVRRVGVSTAAFVPKAGGDNVNSGGNGGGNTGGGNDDGDE